MLTQDIIEKSYYEQLMPGHYIDVKMSESDWKLAKINDRENRYVTISFDAIDTKQQQMFLGSFRVAPLRANTEGYTGSSYRAQRPSIIPISDLKNHLEMMCSKFLKLPQGPNEIAFQLTQYLRGELFVNVHTILSFDTGFKPEQASDIMKFFYGLIDFVAEAIKQSLKYSEQYFDSPHNNKYIYLSHPRIALIHSLQQLLLLLNYILKVQSPKTIHFFRLNKSISHEELVKKSLEEKGLAKLAYKVFMANDSNGKWYPFGVRKQALKIIQKFAPNMRLPKYTIKDYNQVFQIYPYMLQNNLSTPKIVEQEYVKFMVSMLKEQSPFEAKLRSLQELKKILQKETKLQSYQPANILDLLTEKGVLQHMLNDFNFNPQIFKRFVPILNFYCKSKALTQKQIGSLFKLASNRHQSELNTIYEIITGITEFAPVDSLDSIFTDICTLDINDQVTIQFIKNFTVKALESQSNSKSFLSSILGRKATSSKYGFYGLNLLWKEMQDAGRINIKYIPISLEMIKALFNEQVLHSERQNYLKECFSLIQKKKSFGQCIRIMHGIVNSYPISTLFGDGRRQVVEKLDSKHHIIETVMKGLKSHKTLNFQKVSHHDTLKFFYHFLQEHSQGLRLQIRVEHIEYLWAQGQLPLLMEYLRKNKVSQFNDAWKRKYTKKLDSETIKDIFTKIAMKKSFYQRQLTQLEFITLDDLFLSLHFTQNNLEVNERGTIRYIKTNLIGYDFYFNFLIGCKNQKLYDKIIQRMINVYLRPKNQAVDEKVNNWRKLLTKVIQSLGNYPDVCIPTLQAFFTMIQGKTYRENVSHQGNQDILVQSEGVLKTVSLSRNSTIFKLRKVIMQAYEFKGNFLMYNVQMKKDVTFVEEQDFSINAMSYRSKGPSIILKEHRNSPHPHLQAISDFKAHIAGEDKLYTLLFDMLSKCQSLHKEVWAIITMLPTNRSFINKLKNCSDFTRENWEEVICGKNNQQLLYFLNIIAQMINKSDKWAEEMYKTQGVFTIDDMLVQKLKEFDNPILLSKLIRILLKVFEVIDKKLLCRQKIEVEINIILTTLEKQFKDYPKAIHNHNHKIQRLSPEQQEQNLNIKQTDQLVDNKIELQGKTTIMPIQLFNDLLSLLSRCCKLNKFELQKKLSNDNLIFKFIEFALFQSRQQSKPTLSEEIINDLVITHYGSFEHRLNVLQKIITEYLNVEYLSTKQSSQNYFLFLIDMLHSLTKEQQDSLFSNEAITKIIRNFIDTILKGQYEDSSKLFFNQLNWGALKLINYQISSPLSIDPSLFTTLLNQLLFNQQHKRVRHPKTRKLLFEIMKKMLYAQPSRIDELNSHIVPRLQKADWRKSALSAWMLQPEKNQKRLYVGLENLTATCYINCLFQQLYMTKQFRERFMAVNSLGYREGKNQNQIYHLQNIFATLKYGNRKCYTTRPFCQSFITYQGRPIDPTIQSDADEFFNALMEKIQAFLKDRNSMHILENTFQGVLSNQLNCEGCPHRSEKLQHFLSIGVNIKNKKTLDEALHDYVDGEILDGDNAYLCEPCNKKVRTKKRLCIKQLPNVLVIVLKRFEFNYDDMRKIKINHELKYPQNLNMKQYTSRYLAGEPTDPDGDYAYQLKGVVVHAGTSEGGHYYSFIKDSDKWYEFNDEYIAQATMRRVEEESFGGDQKDFDGQLKYEKYKSAYILFYDKVNKIDHPSNQVRHKQMIQEGNKAQKKKIEQNESIQVKQNKQMQQEGHALSQEGESFAEQLQESVENNNSNIEFMSFVMEPTFVRFCQNIAMLENIEAAKFVLLYYHTVVLRDRNRDQYAANLYRILDSRLQDIALSQWFISQITQRFIKEFFIEAPRIVRYLSLGLMLKAMSVAPSLPDNLIETLVYSVAKKGMTPFAKVFRVLSQNPTYRNKLIAIGYDKRVLNYLLDKKDEVESIVCEKRNSYFGVDSSQKEKSLDFCPYSLIQSLTNFPLNAEDAMKLIQQYHSRSCAKIASKAIVNENKNDMELLNVRLNHFKNRVINYEYKKEYITKYMLFLREVCIIEDEHSLQRIDLCVRSLADLMLSMVNVYDPTQYILTELHQLAVRSETFVDLWRKLLDKQVITRKAIMGWVKQSDKPHFLGKNEQWKRKTNSMTYGEKITYSQNNKSMLQQKTRWMFNKISYKALGFQRSNSVLDLAEVNTNVQLGSRKVTVKEHLGLLTKVEYEKQIRWCFVQKNEFQFNHSL